MKVREILIENLCMYSPFIYRPPLRLDSVHKFRSGKESGWRRQPTRIRNRREVNRVQAVGNGAKHCKSLNSLTHLECYRKNIVDENPLPNDGVLVKVGVDIVEDEPCKIWGEGVVP